MTSFEEISIADSQNSEVSILKIPTRTLTTREGDNQDISIIENLTFVGRVATNIEFEKLNSSPDCDNGLSKIDQSVFESSAGENLLDYYHRELNKKRVFFKEIPAEEIMRYSPEMISKPLLQSNNIITKECVKLFKHLLSYMGDRISSKNPIKHAMNHIKLCLRMGGYIFDEAYAQVLKQINDNSDSEKRQKAWNFLAILASSFAPDTKLYYSLMNYLRDQIKENPDTDMVKRCNYIIIRLYNSFEKRRKFTISPEEIKYIEQMKPMQIRIYFFSGTYTTIPFESYHTLDDLKYSMMMKLKLKIGRIPYYGLYEILDKQDCTEERILEEEERVVDMIAMWDYDLDKFANEKIQANFKVYLKLVLHYGFTETDIDTVTLHFYQAKYDIIQGKFNIMDDDISKLAALQIIACYGYLTHEQAKDKLDKEINDFIPIAKLKKNEKTFWLKSVMDEYINLENINTKFDARKIYLDHISKNPLYESHLFWVKIKKNSDNYLKNNSSKKDDDSDIRLIAIKPNEVVICDSNKEKLETFQYVDIFNWGYNSNTFVIVLQDQNEQKKYKKYYFETYQIRSIFCIVQSYCYLIAQLGLQGLTEYLKNYVTNFKNLPKSLVTKESNIQGLRSFYSTIFKK